MNACQKGIGGYPIIPDYGAENGFLYALRCSLKGDMFFGQKVVRDVEGKDLANALEFQFTYAKKVCECLEKRFVDNTILNCVKILVPTQHPSHERLLKDYGEKECDNIVAFYGMPKNVDGLCFAPIINGVDFRNEFKMFKRQAGVDFAKMSLVETMSLLANNNMWKDAFPNILRVGQIALVQCCSSAICERGFSARTKIKTKWRNRMEIESLDDLLRIAIEGWDQMDFSKAMELWKSKANRHLFTQGGMESIEP